MRIIDDFIKSASTFDGYGFFEGQGRLVVKYSKQVSKSQLRKYKRYNKVPLAFAEYLMALETSDHDQLDEFQNSKTNHGFADYIREQILKNQIPDMNVMFGSSERPWKRGKDNTKYSTKGPKKGKEVMRNMAA